MSALRMVTITSATVMLTLAAVEVPRLVIDRLVPATSAAAVRNPAEFRFNQGARTVRPGVHEMADDAPRRTDLRGNEIAKPVARYRVDGRGTLYEVHSPQTEVPRLKAPTL